MFLKSFCVLLLIFFIASVESGWNSHHRRKHHPRHHFPKYHHRIHKRQAIEDAWNFSPPQNNNDDWNSDFSTGNQPNVNDVPNGNNQDTGSNWGAQQENPTETEGENDLADCTCVEPDLCDEEDRVIPTENIQVDWRFGGSQCTTPQVCCLKPKNAQTESPEFETELPGLNTEDEPRPLECGERRNFDEPQNLQDGFARFAEFPWVLKLRNSEDNGVTPEGEAFKCGASLIHASLALTAAHCLIDIEPESIIVRAGEYDVTRDTESLPYQERRVKKIIRHAEFDYKQPKNDIAILVLDEPFDMTDNVNTVCLQRPEDIIDTARCVAAGWGQTDPEGEMQKVLKKIEMPIVPKTECQNSLRNTRLGKYFKLHDSFLCAGGNSADTCVGDGGGPLMCPLTQWDVYVQVGVVSWGINCSTPGRPGVYVDVEKFLEWIYQVAEGENIKY